MERTCHPRAEGSRIHRRSARCDGGVRAEGQAPRRDHTPRRFSEGFPMGEGTEDDRFTRRRFWETRSEGSNDPRSRSKARCFEEELNTLLVIHDKSH